MNFAHLPFDNSYVFWIAMAVMGLGSLGSVLWYKHERWL